MKRDRVVVIGGGIAGLTAAARLARRGCEVKLVEANAKVGGACATTTIDGYAFNDGALHLVMRGMLETVFGRIGLDLGSCMSLRRITSPAMTFLPDGSVVTFGDGFEVAVDGGPYEFSPDRTRAELEALDREWQPLYDVLSSDLLLAEPSPARLLSKTWRFLPRLSRTVASQLRTAITHPGVRAALAGSTLFTGMAPENAPAIGLLAVIATWREGAFLPEGGMGRIPEALAADVQRSGGEILLNRPAERIVVRHGRVAGVDVDGERLSADAVVSAVHGFATFGELVSKDDVPDRISRRIRRAKLSHRAVSVQLGLRNTVGTSSYEARVLPMMEEQERYFESRGRDARWLSWAVPTSVDPSLAPSGGSVLEVFPPIDQQLAASSWDERRASEVLEKTTKALAWKVPLDIAVTRVRTPREFARDMHLFEGALYGLSPKTSPFAMFPRNGAIPGLYLAGQTTYPGSGVPMAAASGLLAADALLQ